uniref:Ionotropic receptor 93a2 n=1 Tax=Streltzoviella insularis TaxID=1206366 RepID=A0A7D5YTV9_9NEOP|nr:ionotropic receptor 93a2 [Streltzoviella insularis]
MVVGLFTKTRSLLEGIFSGTGGQQPYGQFERHARIFLRTVSRIFLSFNGVIYRMGVQQAEETKRKYCYKALCGIDNIILPVYNIVST